MQRTYVVVYDPDGNLGIDQLNEFGPVIVLKAKSAYEAKQEYISMFQSMHIRAGDLIAVEAHVHI